MIDIHCHILPGLDDGAKTTEETLEMAGALVKGGYETVIATPHVFEGREFITPVQIRKKVNATNLILEEKQIPLKVLPGAEVFIFPDLADWYVEGKIISLADTHKYILLELPMLSIPSYTEQVFFELQVLGITPILAHPERNREILHYPKLLFNWVDKGVQIQVNQGSFIRHYGTKVQNFAKALLASGMVHYIGSDLHKAGSGDSSLDSIPVYLKELEAKKLTAATVENPSYILSGYSSELAKSFSLNSGKRNRKFKDSVKEFFL